LTLRAPCASLGALSNGESDVQMVKVVAPGTTVQSVARGLSLLEAVAQRQEPATAQDLATQLGLKLPTAHHLLATLVETGFLDRVARRYRLGTKIAGLAAALDRALKPPAAFERAMHWLADETQETAYVSRWENLDVTIVAAAEGARAVRVTGIRPGLRGHAYARASGKALLAAGPDDRRDAYFARAQLERLTRYTIVDLDAILQELLQVQETGFAIDREHFMEGVGCVAIALPEVQAPPVWALAVTLPIWRLDDEYPLVTQALRHAGRLAADRGVGPIVG
jgi:IclR family transcriptional regulator, acetate operon repressor